MKYTDGSLRNIHGDLWQARFSYRDVPVNDITADMVRTMGQKMLSSGYARETVARAHNALKRFLYLALEEGHISSMPITRSVKPPRLVRKEPNALDDATRKRLLSILDEMPDDQLTLAIRLGLGAGLRNEEALGLQWENELRRACEYGLSLLDMPAQRRRTRSYNVQLWSDALDMQQRVRGGVEDRYPADPAALLTELEREREMRRHEASDAAIARRATELDGNGFESDGYLIRPAATVREILDEANVQHNCVAGFIDKYASSQTDLWLMRKCSDPDRPLVTVEVRGGAIRQAFQSHNGQVTAVQRRFLSDWCEAVGYNMSSGGRMRALGA